VTYCRIRANNFDGASSTALYAIDSNLSVLVIINPHASGTLDTVGPLGVTTLGLNGFDISGRTGMAYASLVTGAIFEPALYTISLTTGEATLVGFPICGGAALRGLSVANIAVPVEPSTWGQIKEQFAR